MRAALARVACRRLLASRSPSIIAPRLLCTSSDQPLGTKLTERTFSRAHNTEETDEYAEAPILESKFLVTYKGENNGEEQHRQFPAPDIQDRTIWVTGLEPHTEREPLIKAFRNCGNITEVTIVDDLRVLPKHERERENVQRGTEKVRVNTRAWSQMQPQVRRRAAFVTFASEVGRANALKPALQMLGVVLTDDKEDKDKGGIVCRPHPAERRKTLIARYNDTEEFPEESSPSDDGLKRAPQLVQDVELLMKPYTFVHSVTLSRHNSVTCTLKCTDFAEARSMLEMLRSEAIRLSLDKKIEFDWALDKERERTWLTL